MKSSAAAKSSPRLTVGERTRQSILEIAVDLASVEGLDGLTIGRLATELDMSKSGLFSHFGSKEELQLATIDAAKQRFTEAVFAPALKARRGLPRLSALCREWIDYGRTSVFPGGCFFAAAAAEFDSRPGPVRDRVAEAMVQWMDALRIAVGKAIDEGDLKSSIDPEQLAFEINAMLMAANFDFQLHDDEKAFDRAKKGIDRLLQGAAS